MRIVDQVQIDCRLIKLDVAISFKGIFNKVLSSEHVLMNW